MEKENNSGLNKKSLRTFCFSFSIGMLLIAVFSILSQILKPANTQINFIPAIITASLFCYHQIAARIIPENPTLRKLHFSTLAILLFYVTNTIWKIVTFVIGTIVFGIIFYLIFTPTSILLKLNKKDHIKKNITGWNNVPEKINLPEQCKRLF